MSNCSFNTACGCIVLLCDGRIKYFCNRAEHFAVVYAKNNWCSQILITLNVSRNADLAHNIGNDNLNIILCIWIFVLQFVLFAFPTDNVLNALCNNCRLNRLDKIIVSPRLNHSLFKIRRIDCRQKNDARPLCERLVYMLNNFHSVCRGHKYIHKYCVKMLWI